MVLAIVGSLSVAHAESGIYGGLDATVGTGTHSITRDGTVVAESDSLTSSSYGLHAGYILSESGRVELSFSGINLEDDNIKSVGADYLYTLGGKSSFKPYIGAGVSYNSLDTGNSTESFTGTGLRVRLGSYFELLPNVELGAELNYNYINWENTTDSLGRDWTLSSSYYGVGVNLNFKF